MVLKPGRKVVSRASGVRPEHFLEQHAPSQLGCTHACREVCMYVCMYVYNVVCIHTGVCRHMLVLLKCVRLFSCCWLSYFIRSSRCTRSAAPRFPAAPRLSSYLLLCGGNCCNRSKPKQNASSNEFFSPFTYDILAEFTHICPRKHLKPNCHLFLISGLSQASTGTIF